jgi:hypothetical protein
MKELHERVVGHDNRRNVLGNWMRAMLMYCAAAIVAACMVVLASCQTINAAPERETEYATMLVIPLEFSTDSSIPSLVCGLKFDGMPDLKMDNPLQFGLKYAFLRNVVPGVHRITRLIINADNRFREQFDEDIPFNIAAGQALLLPVRISLVIKEKTAYFTTYNLLDEDVEKAWTELLTYKGINTWDLGTAAGAKPAVPVLHPADEAALATKEPAPAAQLESSASAPESSAPSTDLASRVQHELEAELAEKLDQVSAVHYSRWLEEKGLLELEANAQVEKRIELLDQFIKESPTRGSAVEFMASSLFPASSLSVFPSAGTAHYRIDTGWTAGGTLTWSYQINNRISFGVNLGFIPMFIEFFNFDETGTLLSESGMWSPMLWLGPLVIVGDKTTSFAVQFSTGFGGGFGFYIPVRLGVYYRNFYAGCIGFYSFDFDHDIMIYGIEAGYSIFFGRKRTWPRKEGYAVSR